MLKPVLPFPGTGTQLAVSDTDTAPEGLFFELVQPPRHGVVLKSSADGQERVRAGELSTSVLGQETGSAQPGSLARRRQIALADLVQRSKAPVDVGDSGSLCVVT